MSQFRKFDVTGSVSVYAFKEALPLVDVVEQVSEFVDVYGAGVVAVKHVCASHNQNKMCRLNKFREKLEKY